MIRRRVQQMRREAWLDGYWARGQDEEYQTDTPCPYGQLRGNDFRHSIWLHLFWLPRPVYYKFRDWFAGNDGWRPLDMRYPEHFGKGNR